MTKVSPLSTAAHRLLWVDYARGWAILLVVYRHTIVGLERMGIKVPEALFFSQEFFMNVRMPIFFALSGVFLKYSLEKKSYGEIINNRLRTILYPYLLWSVLLISLQIVFSNYTNSNRSVADYRLIITQPRELDHMWYLLALFNTTLTFLFLYFVSRKQTLVLLLVSILLHCCYLPFRDYSLFSDIMFHLVFLVAGFVASPYVFSYSNVPIKKVLMALGVLLPFFIAGQLFWLQHVNEYYEPDHYLMLPLFLAITWVACIFVYLVSSIIARFRWLKILPFLGTQSLFIYILHLPLIAALRYIMVKKLNINDAGVIIAASLLLGIAGPIFFQRIISKLHMNFLFVLPSNKSA